MQHVRVYVQNEGAGAEEAVQSVQHNTITQSSIVPWPGQHSDSYISPNLFTVTSFSPVDILLKTQLTACIHFGDVPVPDVLDLVANVVECVDHLVQTLGTLHPSFLMSSEMTYCTGVTTMIT